MCAYGQGLLHGTTHKNSEVVGIAHSCLSWPKIGPGYFLALEELDVELSTLIMSPWAFYLQNMGAGGLL